ncbi:MarR family winged helix-turn-helix transcriptional regulator [Corynebacterium amycolatum]|uniref:MarR family winged helix-turn-helix transcriptional regulator n=1 Tax=Corynebacterium amycolatum TaxID=43765 RepID=UPI000E12FBD3|nr:MarR family winged helix-turn-helix transcriptional regulator [Corynebacterium amycolatum]STB94227.1 MarR-family transcriptional regulator [Corynebacterium amycolatum]
MQDVPWLSDEEQRLWRSILSAKRAVDRSIDLQLQETLDISTADFSVLVVLSETENNVVRMRTLCESLDWDRSRMSHQITRMERRGLVTKERCACDNRGIDVTLTAHGRTVIEKAAPNHVKLVRHVLFDVLGENIDYQGISAVLDKIAETANATVTDSVDGQAE